MQPFYPQHTASQPGNPTTHGGITEIVLPCPDNLAVVLPTLAHLSHQAGDRWFTWFPPTGLTKDLLTQFGFNLKNIRIVHSRSADQSLWYLWEALTEGNSHTVVAHLGKLPEKRLQQLENAARLGNSTGLLIRYR